MVDLPNGVPAVDIGSGTPVANMTMWAVGSDGQLYEFFDSINVWVRQTFSWPRQRALRVSGPIFGTTPTVQVLVLAESGDVFALNQNALFVLMSQRGTSPRTDISAGSALPNAQADGFLSSIMVASQCCFGPSPTMIQAFKSTDGTGAGFLTGTGAYAVDGAVIRSAPMAISSDNDRRRVWFVTQDHRVYYGE
jgi:hypothetical protein